MDGRDPAGPPIGVFRRRALDCSMQSVTPGALLVIVHKAVEGVNVAMLARFLNCGRRTLKLGGEVTLLLTSSAQLRRLNREFRRQDYPTDVLSFPSEVPPQRHYPTSVPITPASRTRRGPRQKRDGTWGPEQRQKLPSPGTRAGYAGDIAISADIARRNGRLLGHGAAIEIKTLILHGLLHLAGYDHESDNGRMARKEALLRRALGLPEGLIERTNKPVVGLLGLSGRRGKER